MGLVKGADRICEEGYPRREEKRREVRNKGERVPSGVEYIRRRREDRWNCELQWLQI